MVEMLGKLGESVPVPPALPGPGPATKSKLII